MQDLADEVGRRHPGCEVSTTAQELDPRVALVAASDGAALMVVGSRGGGRLKEVLLGSVALHVAAHGRSPVAVIPRGFQPADGPILVGVDGSPNSAAAVASAFDEAAVRGVALVAVLSWDELARQPFARRPVRLDGGENQDAEAVLAEQLAGWHRYPDVSVRPVVFRGQPAAALLQLAQQPADGESPQTIVVGSRGRGGFGGLLLGSTSQALITHARCPVVVLRPEP